MRFEIQKYYNVFSSFSFGKAEIQNRIQAPPIRSWMANPQGFVARGMIEFYRSFVSWGQGWSGEAIHQKMLRRNRI